MPNWNPFSDGTIPISPTSTHFTLSFPKPMDRRPYAGLLSASAATRGISRTDIKNIKQSHFFFICQ